MESRLKTFAESLFTKHKVRMYRKEKDIFLSHCEKEFAQLGYNEITIRNDYNMFGKVSKNLLIGQPDADILVTAHYDTPGRNGFLLIFNPLVGMIISNILFLLAIIFLPRFFIAYFDIGSIGGMLINAAIPFGLVASFFIKNKHNHNDNTSGVLGVYKVAELVAKNPELKARCAFVLFDHEEIMPGLLGSRAFAEWRNRNYPFKANDMVVNLDCIGVGDVLTVMTNKKHDGWHKAANFFAKEGFNVRKVRGGLAATSDHAPFSNGISLVFQKRSLLGPLHIPNIHSGRDRVCDLDQVERLGKAVYKYIGE